MYQNQNQGQYPVHSQQQNESVLDFDVQDNDIVVPVGQYIAVFQDVQKTFHQEFGEGVMFMFKIASGEFKDQIVTRIGKPQATNKNSTGKIISGLVGKNVVGQKISLRPYLNKPYNIVTEMTPNGKTRVAHVWAYQQNAQSMPVNATYHPIPNQPTAPIGTPPISPNYGGNYSPEDDIPF